MSADPSSPTTRRGRCRFAPSTTGRAHPGTLLAALLCWLDARSRGAEVLLRLEDLDPERTRPGYAEAMVEDLGWLGLDWDGVARQSGHLERYARVVTRLAAEGRVYACDCSRSRIRASSQRAPDGSFRYPGTCRERRVDPSSWASRDGPLRLRLDSGRVEVDEEGELELSGDPSALYGDPLLRRRDGAFAYQFASVVDDAAAGVDRVVRGRDLATSTVLQVGIQQLLGYRSPTYHHHVLLLEPIGSKLSKLHGAVDVRALRERYSAEELCGRLAGFIGLVPPGTRCTPSELRAGFAWSRVATSDVAVRWSESEGLVRVGPPDSMR